MELKALSDRAMEIRNKYLELEKRQLGREWTRAEIMQGFSVDVGELTEYIMMKEGIRKIKVDDIDTKIAHELSDCLWSLLVLAKKCDVDLEASFLKTMDELDTRLKGEKQ